MEITGSIREVRAQVKEWRRQGLTVGLVPTMGYLHEGHRSLIDRAVAENDRVVVSDFVNPIQFGVNEDLATYPRDIEADKRLCGEAGAESKRGSVRQDEAHTLPGCMYSGMQAVPHCYAGQGLFRAEGRAADGCNPPDGA